MGSRKTGVFHPAEEVLVLTCDVCECDIGHEDGRRPAPYLSVMRHPNAGALGDRNPDAVICSQECLRAYADKLTGLDRASRSESRGPRKRPEK
jgi:hypothetical protein